MRHYYKSFALTIRPRGGITDDTILAFKNWLSKQDHSVAVIEMEGDARHMHIQVWLNEGRTKDDVSKAVKRICERTVKDWDAAQSKVLRGGIRIAYSDWYLEYLVDNEIKGEVSEENIIMNNPPDRTERYYPSEEEQEKVKQVAQAADPRFLAMEQECNEWLTMEQKNVTLKNIAQWLCYVMFNSRTMKVIINQRDRSALCKTLYAYMTKTNDVNYFLEKEQQIQEDKYEHIRQYVSDNYTDNEDIE